MRGNRDNGDFFFTRPIEPKNPVGSGCFVLGVGFEDFLAAGTGEGTVFVGVKPGLPWVCLKITESFSDGFKPLEEALVLFERS